ncbi:MAG TPA: lysophospholipid acyltransferase family protein [Nocardioidaceae bacterium]|nr:lysophospholipid acyltransferase family protein [Nocardioidaceae bacterium]
MGDAEVVPLGTRGRPGRGSGSSKPSAAARTLAGSATAPGRGTVPRPRTARDPRPGAPDTSATAPDTSAPAPDTSAPAPAPAPPPAPAQVREPGPAGGIPAGEWVQALAAAAAEVFGEDWERKAAELLAFLRRRLTGDYRVDEYGFDPEVTERLLLAAVRPLKERWFRVEVRGAENIPTSGGALVVSNHSGTVPVDGLVTMVSVHDAVGRHLRPLGADLVFRLPLIGELARKGGATLACNEDAQRMLSDGELVGVWPEGFKGIGKPFSERYKLQRFGRGGFVSAAMRTGVPIVPCSVVGAEEIYPLVGNVPALARLLGLPYLPVTPFFPWLGPLGLVPLPSKWLIEFGEPIRTDMYAQGDEGAADDPMLVFNVTDQVRETIQQTLYSLLVRRGPVFG